MNLQDETIAKIRHLPESLVQEVSDFVDFILMKHNKVITSQAKPEKAPLLSAPIAEFLRLIQQTPREYWPYLLQMMGLFQETVTAQPAVSNSGEKASDEIQRIDPIGQHEALSKLIQSWIDEGDEQEQTETAEYLRKALEEDSISI